MDKYSLTEQLQKEILATTCDARAEAQLAMWLENGLSAEDFMVCNDGLFAREYSKDVKFTDIKEHASGLSVLQLHLTRTGVYDHLPEGLFFQPAQVSARVTGAAEMAFDHKFNKQREAEIRRFFLPFDNDFFLQRLGIESEEKKLLEGLQTGILNDYFMHFWDLPASLPKHFIVPFILLLPYANKIAGDLLYTTSSLELLLQEKVCIKKIAAPHTRADLRPAKSPGDICLGVDMVCGDQFTEDYPVLECCIGPLKNSVITDYLEEGKCFTLLQTFYRFFLPVEADIQTNIEVVPERHGLLLETGNETVLGYSGFL